MANYITVPYNSHNIVIVVLLGSYLSSNIKRSKVYCAIKIGSCISVTL